MQPATDLVALLHQAHQVVVIRDDELGEILDVGTQRGMLSDLEVAGPATTPKVSRGAHPAMPMEGGLPFVLRIQQIADLLVVDFDV